MTKESGDSSKKEVSTTSTPQFQCPMLKPSNYSLWAIRMQIILEANGLWEMIEPLETTQSDNKKDKTAIAFLYQALPEEQLLQITKHKTAKAIWDALKTRHIGEERVQQARLQTLKSEFEMLHMKEDEAIDIFTAKLTTLVNKAAGLGHTIEDSVVVRKLLNAVPEKFLQIVASIEQYLDLDEMSAKENVLGNVVGEDLTNHEAKKITDSDQKGRTGNHHKIISRKKQTATQINLLMIRVRCYASNAKSMGILQTNVHQRKKNNPISLKKLMATVEEAPGSFINQEESRSKNGRKFHSASN
ncbi:zinc finger, CCHC-type containing protein [Tanacetum coccineum]